MRLEEALRRTLLERDHHMMWPIFLHILFVELVSMIFESLGNVVFLASVSVLVFMGGQVVKRTVKYCNPQFLRKIEWLESSEFCEARGIYFRYKREKYCRKKGQTMFGFPILRTERRCGIMSRSASKARVEFVPILWSTNSKVYTEKENIISFPVNRTPFTKCPWFSTIQIQQILPWTGTYFGDSAISKAGMSVCASQKEKTSFGPVIRS